jgi:hypothetical protein
MRWHPSAPAVADRAGHSPSTPTFPTVLAQEQLRKLRRRQDHCSVEQATNKNRKNLARAGVFSLEGVQVDATRRIPLILRGRGCAALRAKVAGGWIPGPPFATHGDVGSNSWCTPSAMREWIAAAPGDWLQELDGPSVGTAETHSAEVTAAKASFCVQAVAPPPVASVHPVSDAQRVADLTPALDGAATVPEWLTEFSRGATAGEDLWADLAASLRRGAATNVSLGDRASVTCSTPFREWRRDKPMVVKCLEATTDVRTGAAAMGVLEKYSMPSTQEGRDLFLASVKASLGRAYQVGKLSSSHICAEPPPTIEMLRQAQRKLPFICVPTPGVRG